MSDARPPSARRSAAAADSFKPHMLPMGLLFGMLCTASGAMDGHQRARLLARRDDPSHQLSLNDRYREQLEAVVRQLEARNRRLAEIEAARRRTARFMVHDFKTHLGCIIGFSDHRLADSSATAAAGVRDALERIRRQGLRMMEAVSDLLELARLREHAPLRKEIAPVAGILREAVEDLSSPATRGCIELGPRHLTCPRVAVDHRLIGRILRNLVANARVVIDAEVTGPAGDRTQALVSGQRRGHPASRHRDAVRSIPDRSPWRLDRPRPGLLQGRGRGPWRPHPVREFSARGDDLLLHRPGGGTQQPREPGCW